MRKRFKGLGNFTLLFCLVLLILGIPEVKPASSGYLFPQAQASSPAKQDILSGDLEGIQFKDALHSQRVELTETHDLVRKLPLLSSILFQLSQLNTLVSPAQLSEASLAFTLSKDLPVSYHNLRI